MVQARNTVSPAGAGGAAAAAPLTLPSPQQSGKVVSDIVNPRTKHLAGVPAWIEQEITGAL